mgnify:CR=1 FL=1
MYVFYMHVCVTMLIGYTSTPSKIEIWVFLEGTYIVFYTPVRERGKYWFGHGSSVAKLVTYHSAQNTNTLMCLHPSWTLDREYKNKTTIEWNTIVLCWLSCWYDKISSTFCCKHIQPVMSFGEYRHKYM